MPDIDPPSNPDTPIVRFYSGTGRDHRGRSLDEILLWNDAALEGVHDFIQWLFPLDEPSQFNADAPLVGEADRQAFQTSAALRTNLRRSLERMLVFYGFRLVNSAGLRVVPAANWRERSDVWLNPGNHNYLRLTRIMKSLTLLGLPELARALYAALRAVSQDGNAARVGEFTLRYWKEAADD